MEFLFLGIITYFCVSSINLKFKIATESVLNPISANNFLKIGCEYELLN